MSSITILSSRSPVNYLLINELLQKFPVELVIFEEQPFRKGLRLLQRRRKRLGSWRTAQQALFMLCDRVIVRPASRGPITGLLNGHDVRPPDDRVKTLDVRDINAPEALQALQAISPACGVVSGTSILRRPMIESVPLWLNIHCGITPRYRGVHGAFWAIYEGRPDLAGVTVHQIDAGIDTGGIVSQDTIEISATDTYRTLPVKQYLKGTPLMAAAVEDALNGRLTTYQRTDLESKLWYSPTVAEYVTFLRQLKSLTRK